MFLRVLLNLVMHNYPALVSGALQLLFRHFSQRQEVLQAFKQVCREKKCNIAKNTYTLSCKISKAIYIHGCLMYVYIYFLLNYTHLH